MANNNQTDDWQEVDDWADVGHGQQPPAPSRPGQAALEGFGETATLGYLPQIQAGIEKILPNPTADADAKLKAMGIDVPEQSYVQMRDENIARQGQLAKQNPGASMAGKGAGIVASMAMPLPGAAMGKVARSALQGGITGAAYNPGDVKGEVNPLQLEERAPNAALGTLFGTAGGLAGKGIGALANKSRMVDRVKDSANLSKGVKSEIDQALQGVSTNVIKPKADALRELLQGKEIQVNPERLMGIDPKIDRIVSRAVGTADASGMGGVSAKNAQRLKKILDSEANYAQSKPFDTQAAARGESAKTAADVLRSKISEIDPQVDSLNQGMGEAIRARDALARSSRSTPIASIRGTPGTDKGSLVDLIDKMGGSNLEKLSSQIEDAKGLLIKPSNLVKPLEAPNEIRKMGVRAASGAASGAEKLTDADLALFRALLEEQR